MKKCTVNPILTTYTLFACGILSMGIACSSTDSLAQASPTPVQQDDEQSQGGFEIYVFEYDNLSELGSPETIRAVSENDTSVLNSNDLAEADVIITEDDILTYDWTTQKIVLRDTFRKQYTSEDPYLSDFSIFVVSFDGNPLISGRLLITISPVRTETPILYISPPLLAPSEDGLVLYLRPKSMIFQSEGDLETVFPIEDHDLAEQIREHLEINGK